MLNKKISFMVFLIGFLSSTVVNAGLIITIGDVIGSNTFLSVSLVGSGTLSSDLVEHPDGTGSLDVYTDFSGTIINTFPNTRVGFIGDGVGHFANNDIGNYVGPTYSTFTAERLVSTITINNETDGTVGLARWLNLDDDGVGDDFAVILDSMDHSLFDAGDLWSVNGSSMLQLQRGNASDLTLGTYSYLDNALGNVTLIIQTGSLTSVPEPSTLAILALGMIGLASRRFKK
jgi:hypothetical protein